MLILKSPVDTARVDLLLDLFPNAKFVHIYRNPYEVFFSVRRMYEIVGKVLRLQKKRSNLSNFVFDSYRDLYVKYYTDKKLIPKNNLVEIKYEVFIADPLSTIKLIYDKLKAAGIFTQIHYIPVYWQPYYRTKYGYNVGKCKNAETYYSRCLSLPLFPALKNEEVDFVVDSVIKLLG